MAYLPHLDYDLQRFGPESAEADRAAAELDAAMAPLLDDAQRRGGDRDRGRGVRHRGRRTGRSTSTACSAPRDSSRSTSSRARAARPVDVPGLRRGRPPGRARLRRRPRRRRPRARPPAGTAGRRRGARPFGPAAIRARPRALGRARRDRRARRVVHLLLLARRRPGARVRARRRHPPQARLRPGRALLRPGRPVRQGARRPRAGAQEARAPVRDERRARSTPRGFEARTAGCRDSVADTPLLLCSDAALPFWDGAGETVPAARVRDLVLQAAGVGAPVGAPCARRATTVHAPRRAGRAPRPRRRTRRVDGQGAGCTASRPRCTSRSPATASTATAGCS